MSQSYDFYSARADEAAKAAAAAKLDNVRDRELRAEATWRGLASQAQGVAEQRRKIEREKAEARAADAEGQAAALG